MSSSFLGRLARLRMAFSAWMMLPVWLLAVGTGFGMLILAMLQAGPAWLDAAGAVLVATAYAAGLGARTGHRPAVFGGLALLIGALVVMLEQEFLRAGAAVLICAVSAVLAVMVTAPAVKYLGAVRECLLALLVAGIGAFATIGLAPQVSVSRFEYVALGLALAGVFAIVYRLGAGLHGLGRRGLVAVLVAAVVLGATLAYAELVRRYGSIEVVSDLRAAVAWCRENLGAFPRPIVALLGVPALVWGVHMRARRRQGWWLCAFGVAATVAVAGSLVNPSRGVLPALLGIGYGVLIGLLVAYLVIRLDLRLAGSRGTRGRRAEEAAAGRPEPGRAAALL